MPKNKQEVFRLSAALIEFAHDVGIASAWPGVEPVQPRTCISLNLLYSAAEAPYQECYSQELYPTFEAKAAYLFIHIATGHLFSNGNKRTAALCLDLFAKLNGYFLVFSNDEIRRLAISVASYRENGKSFEEIKDEATEAISKNLVPFRFLRRMDIAFYRRVQRAKRTMQANPLSQETAPLKQQA